MTATVTIIGTNVDGWGALVLGASPWLQSTSQDRFGGALNRDLVGGTELLPKSPDLRVYSEAH